MRWRGREGSKRPALRLSDRFREASAKIPMFGTGALIALERAQRPQEQRVAPLRNYLHPLKAAERSGALLE